MGLGEQRVRSGACRDARDEARRRYIATTCKRHEHMRYSKAAGDHHAACTALHPRFRGHVDGRFPLRNHKMRWMLHLGDTVVTGDWFGDVLVTHSLILNAPEDPR